jgi:hypothetical protein
MRVTHLKMKLQTIPETSVVYGISNVSFPHTADTPQYNTDNNESTIVAMY